MHARIAASLLATQWDHAYTREEAAYLLQTAAAPVLIYVMDVADPERAELVSGLLLPYATLEREGIGGQGSEEAPARSGAAQEAPIG